MRTLYDCFVDRASAIGAKVAIVDSGGAMTYAQLHEHVCRIGESLGKRASVGDRVLLSIRNSAEYVIALFGCWSAGLIAAPIDPNARDREIQKVITHVEPTLVLCDRRNSITEKVASSNALTVLQSSVNDHAESQCVKGARSHLSIRRHDDAMIIFTSGTSGDPKGVVLTHENLAANTQSICDYLHLSESDVSVVVLPFHYSYGNSVLQTHLFSGATMHIAESLMYPQLVTDALRETNSTGFAGVPSTFSLLIEKTNFAKDPPPLRYVTQAGGPMSGPLTTKMLGALHANTSLIIMYGQTEATARLTWLPPQYLEAKRGSVGKAVSGVEIMVVDQDGRALKSCRSGQIVARGRNVMSRYWRNQTATEQAIKDGWLYTGDSGWLDDDGFLYINGRLTEMIKVGAHRVSPGEIEEVISELRFINEVAALGMPDQLLGQIVVVFVVGEQSDERTNEIITHCRKHLSPHKVPHRVVWVETFPKTSSGKIKKHELAFGESASIRN